MQPEGVIRDIETPTTTAAYVSEQGLLSLEASQILDIARNQLVDLREQNVALMKKNEVLINLNKHRSSPESILFEQRDVKNHFGSGIDIYDVENSGMNRRGSFTTRASLENNIHSRSSTNNLNDTSTLNNTKDMRLGQNETSVKLLTEKIKQLEEHVTNQNTSIHALECIVKAKTVRISSQDKSLVILQQQLADLKKNGCDTSRVI